jgi:cell division septum initiation protein DivIVA
MLQNVRKSWVTKATHDSVLARLHEAERALSKAQAAIAPGPGPELARLQDAVAAFERASGVAIDASKPDRNVEWRFRDIGAAVRVVLEAGAHRGRAASTARELAGIARHLANASQTVGSEATAILAVLESLDAQKEAPPQHDTAQAVTAAQEVPATADQGDPEVSQQVQTP